MWGKCQSVEAIRLEETHKSHAGSLQVLLSLLSMHTMVGWDDFLSFEQRSIQSINSVLSFRLWPMGMSGGGPRRIGSFSWPV